MKFHCEWYSEHCGIFLRLFSLFTIINGRLRSSCPELLCEKVVVLCEKVVKKWNFEKFKKRDLKRLIVKETLDRCFPVNFLKFLSTPFLTEHLQWLLLSPSVKEDVTNFVLTCKICLFSKSPNRLSGKMERIYL